MDILSLVLAFLGIYGIVFSLRLLLARNIVPTVSTLLNETMAFLEHAEAIRIPDASDYRASLAMYARIWTHSVPPPTDRTQPSQPILTDAYRESPLSGVFPAALPSLYVWSDLEALCPQMASRGY
jgi:hypothetical protein